MQQVQEDPGQGVDAVQHTDKEAPVDENSPALREESDSKESKAEELESHGNDPMAIAAAGKSTLCEQDDVGLAPTFVAVKIEQLDEEKGQYHSVPPAAAVEGEGSIELAAVSTTADVSMADGEPVVKVEPSQEHINQADDQPPSQSNSIAESIKIEPVEASAEASAAHTSAASVDAGSAVATNDGGVQEDSSAEQDASLWLQANVPEPSLSQYTPRAKEAHDKIRKNKYILSSLSHSSVAFEFSYYLVVLNDNLL